MRLSAVLLSVSRSPFRYWQRYVERVRDERSLRQFWDPVRGNTVKTQEKYFYDEDRPWTDAFANKNSPGEHVKEVLVEPLDEWIIFKGDRLKNKPKKPQSPYYTSCRRYSTMATIPEGILLGLGNPLLDITIVGDENFLKKYNLEPNNAIMVDDSYKALFEEMVTKYKPEYGAGGATQNSIRVAQWLLERKYATTFFGGVGSDKNADILCETARKAGVNVQYYRSLKLPTGVCASIITGENRSLVAYLGAADFFTHHFMEELEIHYFINKAQFYYIGGFVFPVCNQAIFDIGQHASEHNKTFVMNLSAPFLCKYFADVRQERWDILPYIDILFGNETEAATFCKLRGLKADSLEEMALATSQLPKKNKQRSRIVVFTQGKQPTVIAANDKVYQFPIEPVDKSMIKDTNGCGDAFVGGFLSQLIQGKDIEDCVRCGNYAARTVIGYWGCNFPEKPDFK